MKRLVWMIAVLLVLRCYGSAMAAPGDQVTVGMDIIILATIATFTFSTNALTFPSADPDTVPTIPASQNPVTVHVKITGLPANSTVTLTVQANGNLISGGNSIPINQISWTATGTGYQAGTMNTTPVTAASWPNSSGTLNRTGTFSYFLKNSWNYATGNYSATATYTLTSP